MTLEIWRERANEKGRREGEEVARRGRGARDGFAWHFAKQHEKDLIIGLSRGRGGMNYTEMKRARRRRRQKRGAEKAGSGTRKASKRREIKRYSFTSQHQSTPSLPLYQTPRSYSDPARRMHEKQARPRRTNVSKWYTLIWLFSLIFCQPVLQPRCLRYFDWAVKTSDLNP